MRSLLKKAARLVLWGAASIAVLLAAGFLAIVQPGGSGVLGTVLTPDGSEYIVEQKCNWSAEPYTVSFYMRSPAGIWGWCYIDHEARRWRDVNVTYEVAADEIVVTEQGVRRAVLRRKTNTFWIDNGSIRGDVNAPQTDRDPTFVSR
jgi:hypothetical protein